MRRNTPKRAKDEREYLKRRKPFLEDKWCKVCLDGDTPFGLVWNRAEQVHHMRGRIGALLLDERFWLPVCAAHHHKITTEPTWAIGSGYSLRRVGAA